MKRAVLLFSALMLAIGVLFSPSWGAQSDYYGVYTGSYTGDDHGIWVSYFNSGGMAWFSFSTDDQFGDGGYGAFGVEGEDFIHFDTWNMDNDTSGEGILGTDGSVSGNWTNFFVSPVETGTYTGHKILSCAQAGEYAGTFAGDQTGTWTMTIGDDGHITGTMVDSTGGNAIEGGINPDLGYYLVIGSTSDGDFIVYGEIDNNGAVSGAWRTEGGYYGGTISGSADSITDSGSTNTDSGSTNSGGGGGGGGCFISAVLN